MSADGQPAAPATVDTAVPELVFDDGLLGFPEVRRFTLVQWGGDDSPFSLLQSLDDPELGFVVTEPSLFFPDYAPVLDDATVERLGVTTADDVLVLVILTLAERAEEATANLLGPLVVHRASLRAAQVVLADGGHDARAPLLA